MIDALTTTIGAGSSAPAPVDPAADSATGANSSVGITFDDLLAQHVESEAARPAFLAESAIGQTAVRTRGGFDGADAALAGTSPARRSQRPEDDPTEIDPMLLAAINNWFTAVPPEAPAADA